jgi:hypothetical protein
MRTEDCPLRCGWRTPLQVLQLELDSAREQLQPATDRILEHLAAEHLQELQLMLAGASGGRGAPVTAQVTQHVDARQVDGAADVVLGVLVPQMRGQLARKLAQEKLRPVDPWPAVQVRRFRWAEHPGTQHPDAPGGMRPAREDERPDLYQLELRTLAVPDTRSRLEL